MPSNRMPSAADRALADAKTRHDEGRAADATAEMTEFLERIDIRGIPDIHHVLGRGFVTHWSKRGKHYEILLPGDTKGEAKANLVVAFADHLVRKHKL